MVVLVSGDDIDCNGDGVDGLGAVGVDGLGDDLTPHRRLQDSW